MACSRPDVVGDEGYATPLAMALCLALTLSVGALAAAAASDLRLARADLARRQAEYALAGAHDLAVQAMLESGGEGPLRWSLSLSAGAAEVLAEPEIEKASIEAAAEWPWTLLADLEVKDQARLRDRLMALASGADHALKLADQDSSPTWRACAPSLISAHGSAALPSGRAARAPDAAAMNWRAGQVWRLRLAANGWVDDRVIRFTGDARRPAATIQRDFRRGKELGTTCDKVFEAIGLGS